MKMQYKQSQKIIIDRRKLDLLIRLGCPDDVIFSAIIGRDYKHTGDNLIDDILECLVDTKLFENWGGNRSGAGRKSAKKNQLENQDENQDANQLENQDANQVVDKDIDKESDKDKDIINKFESFWSLYTPIKTSDGFVAKGNKQLALKSFTKALKGASYETIISGLQQYLTFCRENNRYTKQASTWLNQRGWEDDYGDNQAIQAIETRRGSSFIDSMRDFLVDDSIR